MFVETISQTLPSAGKSTIFAIDAWYPAIDAWQISANTSKIPQASSPPVKPP